MWAWLEVTRPLNCLMAGIGVIIGGFLVVQTVTLPMLAAVVVAALITGAGNTINDYLDVESDRINRPKRPIPSGRIKKNQVMVLTIALFALGIFIAASINWLTFIIGVINALILVVYSFNLQNKLLLGNIAVAYLVGSTFLYGGAAVNNLTLPVLLMLLASLASVSREIVKDLEDLEGDRKSFIKKMASNMKESFADRFRIRPGGIKMRYKTIYPILIASFSLWMAVVISLVPYIWGILGLAYIAVVVPTDAVFIFASFTLIKRRNYKATSKLIKIGMVLGLIAFLAGIAF